MTYIRINIFLMVYIWKSICFEDVYGNHHVLKGFYQHKYVKIPLPPYTRRTYCSAKKWLPAPPAMYLECEK